MLRFIHLSSHSLPKSPLGAPYTEQQNALSTQRLPVRPQSSQIGFGSRHKGGQSDSGKKTLRVGVLSGPCCAVTTNFKTNTSTLSQLSGRY
eukprot:m.184503 g.184503  ORF g.184503 m.184503 type:complete len:91 (-) comp15016_c0_seq1:4129-4401(-)